MKKKLPCIFTPNLRERNGGIYEGMEKREIFKKVSVK